MSYVEPRKSSDKYNNGSTPVGTQGDFVYNYQKPENSGAEAPASESGPVKSSSKKVAAKQEEENTVKVAAPQPFIITGIIMFLIIAFVHGGNGLVNLPMDVLIGWITYLISAKIFKPAKFEKEAKEKKHKLVLTGFAETDDILKKADGELRNIKKSADQLAASDPEYAATLRTLVKDAYKIVDYTSEDRESVSQLRRFYNYYLPTLEKLSRTYVAIEKGGATERISQTREEIVTATEAMLTLFEKQFDKLYQNTAMDISTDVDVLESMLESDGIKATMGGH